MENWGVLHPDNTATGLYQRLLFNAYPNMVGFLRDEFKERPAYVLNVVKNALPASSNLKPIREPESLISDFDKMFPEFEGKEEEPRAVTSTPTMVTRVITAREYARRLITPDTKKRIEHESISLISAFTAGKEKLSPRRGRPGKHKGAVIVNIGDDINQPATLDNWKFTIGRSVNEAADKLNFNSAEKTALNYYGAIMRGGNIYIRLGEKRQKK